MTSLSVGLALLAVLGYAVEIALAGLAIFPGAWLCHALWTQTAAVPRALRILWMSLAGVAAYFNALLLTPFAALFYRLMGATIGRGAVINSRSCADPSLLEIGDDVVIGGHATLLGHSFEGGRLILRRVTIGSPVLIGVNAVVLPGAEIGDGATIGAGAVVPKDTRVAPGTVYVGPPAACGCR
jgi:serine acetyltransferase